MPLSSVTGSTYHKQRQVRPVGLYPSPFVCPQVNTIKWSNKSARSRCGGAPSNDERLPLEQRIDIRLKVNLLTVSDWALIARAFDAWPFAPEVRRPTSYLIKSSTYF